MGKGISFQYSVKPARQHGQRAILRHGVSILGHGDKHGLRQGQAETRSSGALRLSKSLISLVDSVWTSKKWKHLIAEAETLRVEAAHDGPVPLCDAGPQGGRVDAHRCETARQ